MALGARDAALKALYRIDRNRTYADRALDEALAGTDLDPRDRRLATELVYGTTRRRNTLDWLIDAQASRPVAKQSVWVRNILRMAAYQLLDLDRVPSHAVCHEAVELAKRYGRRGHDRFVNAVARALVRSVPEAAYPDPGRDPVEALALRHSHPEWLVRRYLDRLGYRETERLCASNNRVPALDLRVNVLRTSRGALADTLDAEGVATEPGRYLPEALSTQGTLNPRRSPAFEEGLYTVQGEGSMLVGRVVAPAAGETVVDACAAPGGKTTQLAELMGDEGRIIACDIYEHRLPQVAEQARRLGLETVETFCADARSLGEIFPRGSAHRVLVDAPCSGLGTLARRPDLRWNRRPEEIGRLARTQQELLAGVAPLVAVAGTLVYAVCSNEPEETEAVVREFLVEHQDFARVDIRPALPEPLRAEEGTAKGTLYLYPHLHETDGFFMARLVRRE